MLKIIVSLKGRGSSSGAGQLGFGSARLRRSVSHGAAGCRPLPVSFFAVENPGNHDVAAVVAVQDPVILSAEPEQRRSYVGQLFRSAVAGLAIAGQRFQNLQGCQLFNSAEISFGLVGPDDPFTHSGEALLRAAARPPFCPSRS